MMMSPPFAIENFNSIIKPTYKCRRNYTPSIEANGADALGVARPRPRHPGQHDARDSAGKTGVNGGRGKKRTRRTENEGRKMGAVVGPGRAERYPRDTRGVRGG